MTVCGPGTQHDRHQAVFLRPLFSRYHYINQFIRKHEHYTNKTRTPVKVIHNSLHFSGAAKSSISALGFFKGSHFLKFNRDVLFNSSLAHFMPSSKASSLVSNPAGPNTSSLSTELVQYFVACISLLLTLFIHGFTREEWKPIIAIDFPEFLDPVVKCPKFLGTRFMQHVHEFDELDPPF